MVLLAAWSGLIGFAAVRFATDTGVTVTPAELATAPAQPLWFIAVIVAVLATAGEFQHRTIRTTLLHAPRRGQVLAAKATVAAAYGACSPSPPRRRRPRPGSCWLCPTGTSLPGGSLAGWTATGAVVLLGALGACSPPASARSP